MKSRHQQTTTHAGRFNSPFFRALVAATLVFGADASAQNYGEHTLSIAIDQLSFPPEGQDGKRFTVPITSSPTGPSVDGGNTLLWIVDPPEDINWLSGFSYDAPFQNLAFRSADASVRNVFLATLDDDFEFTEEYSPEIVVEHLSLENVNVDPGPAQLRFDGASFSWTLSNSRYFTSTKTPLFKVGVPLELNSVAGTSALAFWNGEIGSPTKVVVDPGTTLVLERVGQISLPDSLAAQLWFSAVDANTADVNGGTLRLDFSGVVFDTAPVASVAAGEVTGGLVVRNGGSLVLNGSDGSDSSTRLELRGGMLVDGSTVSLGERTTIEQNAIGENETVVLNNATVNLEADAAFKAEFTTFDGTSTVTVAAPELQLGTEGFRSPVTFQDAASVLNIRGAGDFFAESLLNLNGGTLNLGMESDTGKLIATGPVLGPGQINVDVNNLLEIQDTLDMVGAGTAEVISIENDGEIRVIAGGDMRGAGAITGSGSVVVESFGVLDAIGSDGLGLMMIDQLLNLSFNSELRLAIDPSAAASSVLKVDGLFLENPASSLAPTLSVVLNNDIVLPVGQKFLLVDYASILSGSTRPAQFRGLPDGGVFLLGANAYQIRYSDPDYGALNGGNDSVITLTVVDVPALQVERFPTESVKIEVDQLLANHPELLGDPPLTISLVSPTTPNGATVVARDGLVFYDPQGFTGTDSFSYIVENAAGQTAQGLVSVTIVDNQDPSLNIIGIDLPGDGTAVIRGAGIPGRAYRAEYSDGGALFNWVEFPGSIVADPLGKVDFIDPGPLAPTRLYRLVHP